MVTLCYSSPSMGYKLLELAAVKLASRASSVTAGGRKQLLFISSDPGSDESLSEINIDGWLLPYGTPDISGNGRHWADVSISTSSLPDVDPPPLALIHSGRRTAPTAATGLPDPAGRPATMQPRPVITDNLINADLLHFEVNVLCFDLHKTTWQYIYINTVCNNGAVTVWKLSRTSSLVWYQVEQLSD